MKINMYIVYDKVILITQYYEPNNSERMIEIKECLNYAIKASGISTTKKGAADAMPFQKDLD